MLEWKFCCYLSLAEFDLVAFVRLFRFLLIRIDILKAFLIHLLPLHEMKISQSDLWVQTLHKWLYSQGVLSTSQTQAAQCSTFQYICSQRHFPSSFPMYSVPHNQYTKMSSRFPFGLVHQSWTKNYRTFCVTDVEKLKKLTLHSVYLTCYYKEN
ncbi:unnamed protein product, partial [Porites lobata]